MHYTFFSTHDRNPAAASLEFIVFASPISFPPNRFSPLWQEPSQLSREILTILEKSAKPHPVPKSPRPYNAVIRPVCLCGIQVRVGLWVRGEPDGKRVNAYNHIEVQASRSKHRGPSIGSQAWSHAVQACASISVLLLSELLQPFFCSFEFILNLLSHPFQDSHCHTIAKSKFSRK